MITVHIDPLQVLISKPFGDLYEVRGVVFFFLFFVHGLWVGSVFDSGRDEEVCKYFCHFFILLCLELWLSVMG